MKDYSAPHKMNEPQSQPEHIMTAFDMVNAIKQGRSANEQIEMLVCIKDGIREHWEHLLEQSEIQKDDLEITISMLRENLKTL